MDWWFAFKFNAASFPDCSRGATRKCLFGGEVRNYKKFSQQFVFASSENGDLRDGADCAGNTTEDPIGATFAELYYGPFYYVLWNDQFYDDPSIKACTGSKGSCGAPWGHSKGMLSWNEQGDGLVLQVTTPSWPAAGNSDVPRATDGNTLGCVEDNNVLVSQHFFALKLTKEDLTRVLLALQNASIVTDPQNPQIVNNGGPEDIQKLVEGLGVKSKSLRYTEDLLSSGVRLISKPSGLHVPPWQMVSAILGGDSLRTATWWASPRIYSTDSSTPVACWSPSLGKAGAVEIATSGSWRGTKFGLKGGPGPDFNHAKVAVSSSGEDHYSIFGDMNQQGSLSGPNCASSQNGRGGLFYVVSDPGLFESMRNLITGDTAPGKPPAKKR